MIRCYETNDKREVIESFYTAEDQNWHQNIHENGGTASENVEDSLRTISKEAVMYRLDCDGKLAAFFTKFMTEDYNLALECWHVAKEFRTKSFLSNFWIQVCKTFGADFYSGLYERNVQAVTHFRKQGFEVINILGSGTTRGFVYKIKYKQCRSQHSL